LHGEAMVLIDQQNVRTWIWTPIESAEITDGDPIERITTAVRIVG